MPTAHEIRLKCLDTQDPITAVRVEWGWSRSEGALCIYVSAVNRYAEGESAVVERAYPVDCIPVPEPNVGVGVLALVAIAARSARARRRIR